MQDQDKTKDQLIDELNEMRRKITLRDVAENKLHKSQGLSPGLEDKTSEEIIHELRVSQIQLEMQQDELKKTQLALEESKDDYQNLYNFAPVGYLTLTPKGVIKQVNLSLSTLLGVARQKLVDRGFKHFVDSENLSQFDIHISSVLKQEEKLYCDLKLRREDGSLLYVRLESVRKDDSIQRQEENGDPRGILMAVTDITEHKQLEEKKLTLAAIIESSNDAIIGKTLDGTIKSWNKGAEKIYGYKQDEVIGKSITILAPHGHEDEIHGFLEQIKSGKSVKPVETVRRKKDGDTIPVSLRISPIIDKDGEIIGASTIVRDISERVKEAQQRQALQEQLLQAQKMEAVGTLAGGIAHDFNNLLQVVLGYSEVLLLRKKEGESDYVDLHKIYLAGKRGSDLVKSLLTFSRKIATQYAPMDLNQEIATVRDILFNTIPKTITINLHLSGNLASIQADKPQIAQVLMNLGLNARDAMPDGGTLTIETVNIQLGEEYCGIHPETQPGNYVLLTVSDTGQGMDKETLSHTFEPFFTTKEPGKGTGLGLATVYGIVKHHGGYIICNSEIGHGTTFNIYLPTTQTEQFLETPTLETTTPGGEETILLVEDDGVIRELCAELLNAVGYKVISAANGKEALEIYQMEKDRISLILLDLIMPVMDGWQCLAKILGIDPKAKVIIASGFIESGLAKGLQAKGAMGFVQKPFNTSQLLTTVRDVLDKNC